MYLCSNKNTLMKKKNTPSPKPVSEDDLLIALYDYSAE